MPNNVALDLFRVDEVGHAELRTERLAIIIEINADNLFRAHHPCALDHVKTNAAKPKHDDR